MKRRKKERLWKGADLFTKYNLEKFKLKPAVKPLKDPNCPMYLRRPQEVQPMNGLWSKAPSGLLSEAVPAFLTSVESTAKPIGKRSISNLTLRGKEIDKTILSQQTIPVITIEGMDRNETPLIPNPLPGDSRTGGVPEDNLHPTRWKKSLCFVKMKFISPSFRPLFSLFSN